MNFLQTKIIRRVMKKWKEDEIKINNDGKKATKKCDRNERLVTWNFGFYFQFLYDTIEPRNNRFFSPLYPLRCKRISSAFRLLLVRNTWNVFFEFLRFHFNCAHFLWTTKFRLNFISRILYFLSFPVLKLILNDLYTHRCPPSIPCRLATFHSIHFSNALV